MKFKYIGAVTIISIFLCLVLQSIQETRAEGSGDNPKEEVIGDKTKVDAGRGTAVEEKDEVALRRRGSSGGSRGSSGGKSSGGSKGSSGGKGSWGSKGSGWGSSSSSGKGTKHTSKSSSKSFTKKAVTFAAGAYTAAKAAKMAKKVYILCLLIM